MGGISEEKLFEAFGLGVQAQELAEPAQDASPVDPDTGVQAQELAEPAQEEPQTQPGSDVPGDDGAQEKGADTGTGKPQLTEQQRRENAARRRQQEQQEAVNQAVAAAVKAEQEKNAAAMSDIFTRAGIKNSFTGEPIRTKEEFDSWYQKYSEAKLQRDLKEGKLTQENVNQMISQHPVVKQAQQVIAAQEQENLRQQAANDQALIAKEIAKISQRDPSIQSVQDLLNMPEAKQFREKVNRGYSFDDAHALVTRERLENQRLEAAKQQAMNNARGKDHLRSTASTRGAGTVSVPPDVMAAFRQFNPGATDAEIQAYYNKYQKG